MLRYVFLVDLCCLFIFYKLIYVSQLVGIGRNYLILVIVGVCTTMVLSLCLRSWLFSCIWYFQEPSKHVFHIITDRLNYAAMRMWFQANPPDKATIEVQNIEEFTWLNASYSPVLKQLGSSSMIDYYFRAHRASSDSNMKFRNPKYLSILNHLRFYLLSYSLSSKGFVPGWWYSGAERSHETLVHRFEGKC